MPLFRSEAIAFRAERLNGEINLALPLGWQAIGYLLLSMLLITAIFLFSASYARVETVSGQITPDKGIAVAVPTRAGVVSEIFVREGQAIAKGAPVARISSEETLSSGQSAQNSMSSSLAIQDARLFDQSSALETASRAERERLSVQISGLQVELASLADQMKVQNELVLSAQKELDQAQEVAARGFISRRDMLLREEQVAVRKQQLSQMEQSRAGKMAQRDEAKRAISQAAAQSNAQSANIEATRQELIRQNVNSDASGGYILTAPASGIATAITSKVGQPVGPSSPIVSIIPRGSAMRAELPIPATMIGFVQVGQEVSLSVDAYPYQQFGTVKARVTLVPAAAIAMPDGKGGAVPVYPIVAEIANPFIHAFGKKQLLLAGMTLSARITTRKQSLIEWLFEPLYAVRRR